jgi:autotransporter-associated beta strand protein
MLKFVIVLCSVVFVTAAALAQPITYVWTNQNPQQLQGVGDLNITTNWNPNGAPTPMTPTPDAEGNYGDLLIFDGQTTGPLRVTSSGGTLGGFGGQAYPAGVRVRLTANQTSPVTFYTSLNGTPASPTASGGLRMNSFDVQAGAGGVNVGINSTTNIFDIVAGEIGGQVFGFTNNSSVPSVIYPDVRWRMGGAGAHPYVFTGTGDWIVYNHLRAQNTATILIQKYGPGTMTWYGTNVGLQADHWKDAVGSPIIIGEGTMIWKTSDLVSALNAGNPNINHNGTLWKYDVQPTPGFATGPGQILGNISGAGPFEMAAGTLTFGGANTFSGNIILTGGTLIAGSTENVGVNGPLGQGGIISFNGGTLGWSLANAFDYSSRFSTANNQAYNLDTGGASPTLATGLTSSGGSLTKLGGGTLTLAGNNTYTGPTTVSGGTLVFQGTKSGNANITVADGASLGVVQNGSQITPGTLTLGSSSGVTLEFNNVTNKTVATLAPNNLVSAGTVTINVNSGVFLLIGETFPLLKWTTGTAPAVTLGFLAGAGGHLTTNGNQIDLVIDNPPYIWTGASSLIWDTSTVNWLRNASPVAWVNGNYALLDDTAGARTNLTLSGSITPTNATIANNGSAYTITNSPGNVISGGGGLTKSGTGSLLLPGGANNYTGVTTVGGGVLMVEALANGGVASDIGAASSAASNLVLNGGTLQYTGPGASIDRLYSVGPGGGTIENIGLGVLAFTNSDALGMSGNGPRTLTLTGAGTAGDTLAGGIVNHPAGTSLRKEGAGLWILTGTNTYAGGTTLLAGSLQVGSGGPSGSLGSGDISTTAGTIIDFQRAGTLLVPGSIDGGASVTVNGTGTVILANNNGYNGGTTINTGTLQVGNGGGSGSLAVNSPIVNNSLLDFNTSGSFAYQGAGLISGSGNVIFRGGGTIKAIGANSYAGWTRIDANTTLFAREGQDGALLSSVITNNGTLRLVEQNSPGFTYSGPIFGSGRVQVGANNVNVGQVVLLGTNTYTGGTFIGGNELILGDGANIGFGSITGNVQFVNNFTTSQDNPRTLTFNRPAGDDFTFSGNITTNFASPQANLGIVQLNGGATITLTGNNTYGGGTVINNGTLQVGNGGGTGSIGSGPVTLTGTLIFNRSGNLAVGPVTGAGTLVKRGSGTVTLRGASSVGSAILESGTLGLAPIGSIGSLDLTGELTLVSGSTLLIGLDRTLSPSNSVVNGGIITHTNGGILRLVNGGPPLQVGDKFTIFSQPVPNGASMTLLTPGFSVQNDLAVDGSVTVTTVLPAPTITATVVNGTNLNLTWPAAWTGGVFVQGQTNSLAVGISNNWVTVPGSDGSNSFSTVIRQSNPAVFFRLITP